LQEQTPEEEYARSKKRKAKEQPGDQESA